MTWPGTVHVVWQPGVAQAGRSYRKKKKTQVAMTDILNKSCYITALNIVSKRHFVMFLSLLNAQGIYSRRDISRVTADVE